jgi:hypothetical protein
MEMMKLRKMAGAAVVVSVLFAAVTGCEKQEGPAEKAGKSVDKAMDKVGQQIEKAGESVQDAAKGENKK